MNLVTQSPLLRPSASFSGSSKSSAGRCFLNAQLRAAAAAAAVEVQLAVISGFGSDASIAMKFGHVARAACLAFPTQNTHGFEIAHLGAIGNCASILKAYCEQFSDD